jgi:hypothetical protein
MASIHKLTQKIAMGYQQERNFQDLHVSPPGGIIPQYSFFFDGAFNQPLSNVYIIILISSFRPKFV